MRAPIAGSNRLSFIEFQLPSLTAVPPDGNGWLHEIKHDGYRTEIIVECGHARALTRRGFDWSSKYALVVEAAAKLKVNSAIIDGEVIVFNGDGRSDFAALRSAVRWQPERLVFMAFDLLHLDGMDFRGRPLIERRVALSALIGGHKGGVLQFNEHVAGGGTAFFREVDRLGLEGMVSKRVSSPYRSGRTETWLKTKCYEEAVYEVAGVLCEPGRPTVAYLVTPDANRRYVGGAYVALNDQMLERLWARVQSKASAVKGVEAKRGTQRLKPGLIARVRCLKGEAKLQHATLQEVADRFEEFTFARRFDSDI
jgi:bifunctional non-homologous end joining protein LigD